MAEHTHVAVSSAYVQAFGMSHLHIEPDLVGAAMEFDFEGRRISIVLPALPDDSFVPNPHTTPGASIRVRNSKTDEILEIDVHFVTLLIGQLIFQIPSEAASYPATNVTLYSREELEELNAKADGLFYQAQRAMDYWLRVVRWKTGYGLIGYFGESSLPTDGGQLVNIMTNNQFYSPRVSRTIVLPGRHLLKASEFAEIQTALTTADEPPVWHDYFASAEQRQKSSDLIAAFIDMAVASEALIRAYLDTQLPPMVSKGVRENVRRMNMSEIFSRWNDLDLPETAHLKNLKTLFDIRNSVMHRGRETKATNKFFQEAATAVRALLSDLK